MAWTDTLVHPIEAEDNAIALIKFESGAIGQFEVSWTFRGGMDLRDEVAGTEGTIWTNHFLRTGFEMFSSGEGGGYVAEKAETASGWLFPVGDEVAELGYVDMFTDMFDSIDEGRTPRESFYDGYVVNAIMDAVYASSASRRWETVQIDDWRGGTTERIARQRREHDGQHGDQGGADAGRPPQADPQGRVDGRVLRRGGLGTRLVNVVRPRNAATRRRASPTSWSKHETRELGSCNELSVHCTNQVHLRSAATRRRASAGSSSAEPTPTATAPAAMNAAAFAASTPPVTSSGTSASGASRSRT